MYTKALSLSVLVPVDPRLPDRSKQTLQRREMYPLPPPLGALPVSIALLVHGGQRCRAHPARLKSEFDQGIGECPNMHRRLVAGPVP